MTDTFDLNNKDEKSGKSGIDQWLPILILSVVVMIIFAFKSWSNFALISRDAANAPIQQKTMGEVTHVGREKVEYKFTYQGLSYSGIQNTGDAPPVENYQQVEVYFNPAYPLSSSLRDFHQLPQKHYVYGILLLIPALMSFALAVVCLTQAFDWKKQNEDS